MRIDWDLWFIGAAGSLATLGVVWLMTMILLKGF